MIDGEAIKITSICMQMDQVEKLKVITWWLSHAHTHNRSWYIVMKDELECSLFRINLVFKGRNFFSFGFDYYYRLIKPQCWTKWSNIWNNYKLKCKWWVEWTCHLWCCQWQCNNNFRCLCWVQWAWGWVWAWGWAWWTWTPWAAQTLPACHHCFLLSCLWPHGMAWVTGYKLPQWQTRYPHSLLANRR